MENKINLRNIGIVAHVDAGKTTVSENMLYISGKIRSLGSVDRGTASTDWLDIERERGISVRASSTSFTWRNININLIDTPGHTDFSSEVERSLRILDGAILIISAVDGVQSQTEVVWNALRKLKIPTIVFVNKIDRAGSNVSKILCDISRLLSSDLIPVQVFTGEGTTEPAITNVFSGQPGILADNTGNITERISDVLAKYDDDIFNMYIKDGYVRPGVLHNALARYTHSSKVFPVLFGAAIKGIGINELMDAVIDFLPPPEYRPDMPVSGIIFKIEHDKKMGRIAHVRLYNGVIKNRDTVYNFTQGTNEKVTQIRKAYASKYEDTGILSSGDIASVCGLSRVRVGDIIGTDEFVTPEYRFAQPFLTVQAFPENIIEYPQLVSALQELSDEDPLLDLQWLKNERELHVKIMGIIQLEVLTSILKSRFYLNVTFGKPSVIYKETPVKKGEGFVAYTMPKPCWAVLKFMIEPGEKGSGLSYSSIVRDEAILIRYQNQVEKTIPEALKQGPYGWEVIDLKITLIEGEHHVMHTHPLDFVVATPMAIMDGLVNTGTTLLEPLLHFRINVPEDAGNKVVSDIVHMRGEFDSPLTSNGTFTVEANIPVAASLDYSVRLGSISGGRGTMTTRFLGYRECPLELGTIATRRGINPLDHSKYILGVRKALL